ncbi:aldo/keto reductase [Methylomonas sp. AM2-LC]|uniref:aldo/keto reductase family protein n=1 Tax=Methylomonas sp. AM2-LC TaxID=3153301 RepID=UPI0032637113
MHKNIYFTSAYAVKVPQIIYGTAWKKERTAALVEQAINLGFRGIDTACQPKHYQEAGVGQGIAASLQSGLQRSELYLQTKFTPLNGQDPLHIPYDKHAPLHEQVQQSFHSSLQNLQTHYLDCLVLHSPLPIQNQLQEVWQAMERLVLDGHVRQLGISNCYDPKQLELLYNTVQIKPAIIQNRFYKESQYDKIIRDFCHQHNIIYQSFWTLTANPHILANSILQKLATRNKMSSAQIFFRYLNQINIVPLTGTSSATHMREDLAIFNFDLSRAECDEISSLF